MCVIADICSQDLINILIDVVPALDPCHKIRNAIKGVYAAENDVGDVTHTLVSKGVLESINSILNRATDSMQNILHARSMWEKILSFRDPLPGVIQKIKNFQMFWRALQWMQGQLFNSQYHVNTEYDAGEGAEFFQTGVVVFRCDVHLDILVTLCQDLGRLGQNKVSQIMKELKKPMRSIFPKTANKLLALKRLTQLVSYGDSSFPLGAFNSLMKSSKPAHSETMVVRATKQVCI